MEFDYIKCGNNVELMKQLPDCCIDLTVTSPPYDNLRTYNGFTFDFENVVKELYRITKDGGVVVWVVSDQTIDGSETGTSFRQALYFMECGFKLHDTMIWKKDSFSFPNPVRYHQNFEYMFVFSKGKPKHINLISDRKNKYAGTKFSGTFRNKDGTMTNKNKTFKNATCKEYGVRFNVWEISSEKANKTGHPAVFPEQLANDHIISWSNEGDIVFDPFLGSGTTCKMALLNNRHYIGFEISQRYCEIAQSRLS